MKTCIGYTHGDNQDHNGQDVEWCWNPIESDSDALRLAVRLRFGIKDFSPHCNPEIDAPGMIEVWREDDEDPIYVEWYKADDDRYAATRLAIVKAAAEIGRKL